MLSRVLWIAGAGQIGLAALLSIALKADAAAAPAPLVGAPLDMALIALLAGGFAAFAAGRAARRRRA